MAERMSLMPTQGSSHAPPSDATIIVIRVLHLESLWLSFVTLGNEFCFCVFLFGLVFFDVFFLFCFVFFVFCVCVEFATLPPFPSDHPTETAEAMREYSELVLSRATEYKGHIVTVPSLGHTSSAAPAAHHAGGTTPMPPSRQTGSGSNSGSAFPVHRLPQHPLPAEARAPMAIAFPGPAPAILFASTLLRALRHAGKRSRADGGSSLAAQSAPTPPMVAVAISAAAGTTWRRAVRGGYAASGGAARVAGALVAAVGDQGTAGNNSGGAPQGESPDGRKKGGKSSRGKKRGGDGPPAAAVAGGIVADGPVVAFVERWGDRVDSPIVRRLGAHVLAGVPGGRAEYYEVVPRGMETGESGASGIGPLESLTTVRRAAAFEMAAGATDAPIVLGHLAPVAARVAASLCDAATSSGPAQGGATGDAPPPSRSASSNTKGGSTGGVKRTKSLKAVRGSAAARRVPSGTAAASASPVRVASSSGLARWAAVAAAAEAGASGEVDNASAIVDLASVPKHRRGWPLPTGNRVVLVTVSISDMLTAWNRFPVAAARDTALFTALMRCSLGHAGSEVSAVLDWYVREKEERKEKTCFFFLFFLTAFCNPLT
jgi:hypothetical protein